MYYDYEGNRISPEEWVRLLDRPDGSRWRVALTRVGRVVVSTVWLGLDHNWGPGAPAIFETMTFAARKRDKGSKEHLWQVCDRYATRDEAWRGHWALVSRVRARGVGALL